MRLPGHNCIFLSYRLDEVEALADDLDALIKDQDPAAVIPHDETDIYDERTGNIL